jgi:hypothetical protein
LACPHAAVSRGMSGRQGAEPGRVGCGGDAAAAARIVVGEVPAEASGGPVEATGAGWEFDQREAIAVGRHVLPRWAEHAEFGEPILARDVQRKRAREWTRHVQAPDR